MTTIGLALLTIVIILIAIVLFSYGGYPWLAMLALIVGIIVLAYILLNPIMKRVENTVPQNQEPMAQPTLVQAIPTAPTIPECYISWDSTGQIPADIWGNYQDEDKQACPQEVSPGEFKGRLGVRLYCVCNAGP